MHTSARRRDAGAPLRATMKDRHMGLQALAAATRLADPDHKGISFQLVGFLATEQAWARETTTPHSARLIEDALAVPRGTLFDIIEYSRSDSQPDWEAL